MKPYKCNRVLLRVDETNVGVVEGFYTQAVKQGGVEPNYKSNVGRHVRGGVVIPFSLRRWMYIDPNKKRLFHALWKNKTEFTLHFGLHDGTMAQFDEDTHFIIYECVAYRWKPIMGAANDIIGEELIGEGVALDWVDPCPCEGEAEIIVNGDFETGTLAGWVVSGAGITSTYECNGDYAAALDTDDYIEQTLETEMPVQCIEEFSLNVRYGGCFSASYEITVTYTDDTTMTVSGSASGSCQNLDILETLDTYKTVKKIKIKCTVASSANLIVDDVTLKCNGGYY